MGQALQQITQQTQQLNHWTDLWFDEHKRAGYVAVTNNFKKHYFYGSNDADRIIKATAGRKDQYISLNAFDVNWKEKEFSRKTINLKQIRNIAIDIDQYNLGLSIDDVIDELHALQLENKIPEPNLVLTSRGVQIFYSIDRGASPDMAWLVDYITDQFISKLQHLGADGNAKDMSRVMRVPNSINSRNNTLVKPEIWNDRAYTLQDLQSYCKPLDRFRRNKKTRNNVVRFPTSKGLIQHYKTNFARTADFDRLIELRNGDFTGMRNVFLYIYSYHQALKHDTQQDLIAYMEGIFKNVYSRTDKPLSKNEFKTTVRSAYKDAEAFFKHYQANGYQVIFKQSDGIIKPYKTSNLIKKLNITEDEQYHMKSVRSADVERRQRADYMRRQRRAAGMKTRSEYEQDRKEKKRELMFNVKKLKEQGLTHKEVAEKLGISRSRVSQLLKEYRVFNGV